jgi:alanine racemase
MDAKQTLGEPRLLISRTALLRNIALLRKSLLPKMKICAVVKADAYGLGADLVLPAIAGAVDQFAVADIAEAAALPPTDLPILILRPVENAFLGRHRLRLEMAIANNWSLTICSPAAADDLARIAASRGRRCNVQIMIDTGMTRCGVSPEQFSNLLERVLQNSALRLTGIYSHFACSEDASHPFNAEQLATFEQCIDAPRRSGMLSRVDLHMANSGGVFFHGLSHYDMVRPGISIFGIDPICRPSLDRPLRPAMQLTAPLIGIRDVPAGTAIGYGQTWRCTVPSRIGLVPIGYADGYPRSLSNKAAVRINGFTAPVVGAVSMDLTTIDLTQVPHAAIGDEVTVLDCDPLSPASVYRLAEHAGTIPYEILTGIGPRVHRVALEPEADESTEANEADPSLDVWMEYPDDEAQAMNS